MNRIERLAGRVAHDFSRLSSLHDIEDILDSASLVRELTEELDASAEQGSSSVESVVATKSADLEGMRLRILVVETIAEDRSALSALLREHGYDVLECESAEESMRLCQREDTGAVDLLLTDVLLGDMSGRELAERISLLRPEITAVYMSGYAEDEVPSCVLAPAALTIKKPVTPPALAAALAAALEHQVALVE